MEKKPVAKINQQDLARAFVGKKNVEPIPHKKEGRKWIIILIAGGICLILGLVCILCGFLVGGEEAATLSFSKIPSKSTSQPTFYSKLTGIPVGNEAEQDAPVYCMQTPNGVDGARPQAGLTEAGVIFEAVAEAGITRFAAIYQNPGSAVIGPIRSLRTYYLEWDTPFDCAIVHAGGAGDALAAVASGGYKDLDENYTYMFRGTYGSRLWNNLFTTAQDLRRFSDATSYDKSSIKGFKRMTPQESDLSRVSGTSVGTFDILKPYKEGDSERDSATNIKFYFGGSPIFDVAYTYNPETNLYSRSYGNGAAHEVYQCASEDLGQKNPEDVCTLTQMTPAVVIAMVVQEKRAADNYHEDITTIGSGDAYVFQNGTVIKGVWKKPAVDEQISFFDEHGNEIALAPGQTFISAVPGYGSIEY